MIKTMSANKERILVVESDPMVSDLIGRQTLIPMGYRVQVVEAAATAIQDALRFSPDLILADLNLPGLSGKDLLVALTAQGLDVPVIVIAEKGMENDVIQAFRLGATDFLTWPVREAEVLAAVERVLKQGRARREKEMLARQLDQTNQELQHRIRDLTTIFSIGKAVVSITDLRSLFEQLVEGAVQVAEGEMGWLLTKDERSKAFVLSAVRNLPRSISAHLNQPWDDGLSSLVALSGETLSIHGEPMKRFKVASLGQSALVAPVKAKNEVVGILVVVRKTPQPFGAGNQAMLEAVADYASIAMVNGRLFRALEQRAHAAQGAVEKAQVGEMIDAELASYARKLLQVKVLELQGITKELQEKMPEVQQSVTQPVRQASESIHEIAQGLDMVQLYDLARFRQHPDLNELLRNAMERFQRHAQKIGISLSSEISPRMAVVDGNGIHLLNVIDSMLTHAFRLCLRGGQVTARTELNRENQVHMAVQCSSPWMDEAQVAALLEAKISDSYAPMTPGVDEFMHLYVSLPLARQVAQVYGGRLWAESQKDSKLTFHLALPLARK
jgi:FixJ family two-component response regulator